MKLLRTQAADEFIELNFKPASLEAQGLPQGQYRLRSSMLDELVGSGGHMSTALLIYGLMDWLDVTDEPIPTLRMLNTILNDHIPADERESGRCVIESENGARHVFYVGPVDIAQPVIAWQRRQWIAAVANRHNEEIDRVVVSAPAAISVMTARSIFAHARPIDMGGPLDSYDTLRATSGRTGAAYSWDAWDLTAVCWDYGLGYTLRHDVLTLDPDYKLLGPGLAPNQLARLVAIGNGLLRIAGRRSHRCGLSLSIIPLAFEVPRSFHASDWNWGRQRPFRFAPDSLSFSWLAHVAKNCRSSRREH